MKKIFALIAAAGLAWATPATAQVIDLVWSADARFERSLEVAPGKFAELCGPLRPGQVVGWSFDADRALDFNIHFHVDKAVRYPARQDQVASLKGELRVDAAQDYCWMWTNKSAAPARLSVRLARS